MTRLRSLTVGIALVALLATGCVWSLETLDGQGGKPGSAPANNTGDHNSAVVYNGRPHVFYYDDTGGNLRHAFYNGYAWVFETLDGHQTGPHGQINSEVGMYTSAVIYNGRPHVFYYSTGTGDLRHGWYNGIAWSFESLDGHQVGPYGQTTLTMGQYTSVVIYNGRPHVFYYGVAGGNLRHAWYNGLFWSAETLDGAGGSNGRINALVGEHADAMIYAGRPHVFYFDDTGVDLRHGYWNGQFWAFETLDGKGGPNGQSPGGVGEYPSAVVYNFRPHVFYWGTTDNTLRHGYYNGQFWAFETLDGNGGANGRVNASVGEDAAAVIYQGLPRVFYYDHSGNYGLREARYTGSTWLFRHIDGKGGGNGAINGDVGRHNAPLVDGSRLRLFYEDLSDNALRHAWFG